MNRKQIQRLIIFIFGLAFIGSTGFAAIGGLFRQQPQSHNNNPTSTRSPAEELKLQALGYQKVLEREPNNTTALNALWQIKYQIGDLDGAIAPLTKLTELYPERTELSTLLIRLKAEQVQKSNSSSSDSSSPNSP